MQVQVVSLFFYFGSIIYACRVRRWAYGIYLHLVHHRISNSEFVQMFSRRRSSNQDEGLFVHYIVIPVVRILTWSLVVFYQHEIKKRESHRRIVPTPRSIHSRRRRRALARPLPKVKSRCTSSQSKSFLLNNLLFELP
jgi:hypothetical protein